MCAQIENWICDELAGPVERRLPAAEGFDEFGAPVGTEMRLLRCRYVADFASPARVHGVELRCDDVGWGRRGGGGGFGGEEARDEAFLEVRGGEVRD